MEACLKWIKDRESERAEANGFRYSVQPAHPVEEGFYVRIDTSGEYLTWTPDCLIHTVEQGKESCQIHANAVTAALSSKASTVAAPFQDRVRPWLIECFGQEISDNITERCHRFLEEALETVQSQGCTASEAHQLVDYVYGRPIGEPTQEVGGVMVTLAALCLAAKLDMHKAGETELARIWTKVEKIRAKQAAKPQHSPLPAGNIRSTIDVEATSPGIHGDLTPFAKRICAMTEPQLMAEDLKHVRHTHLELVERLGAGVHSWTQPALDALNQAIEKLSNIQPATIDVEACAIALWQEIADSHSRPNKAYIEELSAIILKHLQPTSESDELRQYRQCIKSLCAMAGCTDRELAGWITAHKASDDYKHWLQEILAVMHGDGGHYLCQHGVEKSTRDAMAIHHARGMKIDELETKASESAWISLKVQAPSESHLIAWEDSHWFLVLTKAGSIFKARRMKRDYEDFDGHGLFGVTHWQPLPQPPAKESK